MQHQKHQAAALEQAGEAHLEHFTCRVLSHQLLQAAPVGPRHLLGDATAPLQVQLIHLLADVVPQHTALAPDLLLER